MGSELEEGTLPPDNVEHDELDDELPPEAGQPAEGTGDPSPEAGQVEGQEPASAGEPPQHPDNVDVAAMTDDQYEARVNEDPSWGRRGHMKDADYRKKTDELARDREQLDADQRQFREAVVQDTEANQVTPAAPAETPASVPGMDAESGRFLQELTTRLGHEPSIAEFSYYAAQDAAQKQVKPLEEQQAEQEQRQALDRFTEQMAELQQKYPEATEPGMDVELAKELDRIGSDVTRGDVEKAFLSLKGPELLEKARAGKTQAREQQRQQAQAQPAVPPATAAAEVTLPDTSNFDEIERAQLKELSGG